MSMSDLQLPCLIINLHNNSFDIESNQYGEVVQFFQEIRIDIKNMHFIKRHQLLVLVRDFDYLR